MVERHRDVPHPPHGDLSIEYDRPVFDAVGPEDRDLGVVEQGRREEPGGAAGARDREGAAAQLVRRERSGMRRVREATHVRVELLERTRVASAHGRSGDATLRARAGYRAEIDAELLREAAHERRRACWYLVRRSRTRYRSFAVRSSRGSAPNDDEHGPYGHDLAFADEDLRHSAGRGRRDLDCRLVSRDLNERIVLGDLLALRNEPARDLALGQSFTEVRQLEFVAHARSMAWMPFAPLTTCVTCKSTETLASASASLREM